MPISYDLQEWSENISGGSTETKVIDFSQYLVAKAQRAARIKLYRMFYGFGTTAAGLYDSLDTQTAGVGANFQSCRQALTHDAQYGHLTRTDTTTNSWWQGGSLGTISETLSRNLKKMRDLELIEGRGKTITILDPARLRAIASGEKLDSA